MAAARDAVILTCHGTIADLSDLEGFLRNVRRGRPPPPELVHEVRRRYELIGPSPLLTTSREQAALLEARLGVPCRAAGRLWGPYPSEILSELAAGGATRILSLPLAPQSVHVYHAAVEDAAKSLADGSPVSIVRSPPWGDEPALIDAFLETIVEALATLGDVRADEVPVVLTAHSLPVRAIQAGDPYEAQFRGMAALVAERLAPRGHRVEVAFQSRGATADEWLGPDFGDTLRELSSQGFGAAIVAPIGFCAEHVETLYDLDIEGAAVARDAKIHRFARARAVGTRARFIDALEAVAKRALGAASPAK